VIARRVFPKEQHDAIFGHVDFFSAWLASDDFDVTQRSIGEATLRTFEWRQGQIDEYIDSYSRDWKWRLPGVDAHHMSA
jgi:hypothetical protein